MNLAIRTDRSFGAEFSRRPYIVNRQGESAVSGYQPLDIPKSGNYDTVSIQGREALDDDSFIRALSRSAVDALRSGISETRTSELHQQVQTGTYMPVSSRIAERLLGYRA